MTWDVPQVPNYCSPKGAETLKEKIEDYWRERGYHVRVQILKAGFHMAARGSRCDIRSDLLNGIPPVRLSTMVRK